MKYLRRALLIIFALWFWIVAAVVAWAMSSAFLAGRQDQAFSDIQENASRNQVITALGKPDKVRECGKYLWWGGDAQYRGVNNGRCATEERYEYFLTAYGIGYSSDGRVVSKYRYFSE